ncbi:unnamed protein product [Brachionus calyciflorus]|uniref:Uncharacterized protein n=1 Tax=Brachionus calyciflorus TaxID=104777 RepID=A0A814MWS6_9BILA|nr:unnamed protein product [Brachionus calyciflorus]
MARQIRNFDGHQTMIRMVPIVNQPDYVQVGMEFYRIIGPIRYFRVIVEFRRADTVIFVKFYEDQNHVDLMDHIIRQPFMWFGGERHHIQVKLNADNSHLSMDVDYPNMLVYMKPKIGVIPIWYQLVSVREIFPRPIEELAEVSKSNVVQNECDASPPEESNVRHGVRPKRRGNCVLNQFPDKL